MNVQNKNRNLPKLNEPLTLIMKKIEKAILLIDQAICKNIDKFDDSDRGLLSQNILGQLRNLVEYIGILAYSKGADIEITYTNLEKGINHIKANGQLKFLRKFHKLLQITASHYTLDEENSERLMLKYYEYLLKIKSYLKDSYNLEVLANIDQFPLNVDNNLKEYYERIAEKVNQPGGDRVISSYNDRYYIQKIKPFFVNHQIFYEVTFTRANDKASKFDRIIAFTKLDITPNYAVKLRVSNESITILGKNMPIHIIEKWEVSIRGCEMKNFAKIFNVYRDLAGRKEFYNLMRFLTTSGFTLTELIQFDEGYYNEIKSHVLESGRITRIYPILDRCREIVLNGRSGSNVIKYLLYRMNNKIIKRQYKNEFCKLLSDLNLQYGCIPFDDMPFISSLLGHNPRISDLLDCIDSTDRKHEILARRIKNNTETQGELYTPKKELDGFENLNELIATYNGKVYWRHKSIREIVEFKEHYFIKGYESDTIAIIRILKELSSAGIMDYEKSVEAWLNSGSYTIDCIQKQTALKKMFEYSHVSMIYGSAGTGKSTLINHISHFFNNESKLYLANTNPAVDNLKRKVNSTNCTFKTIAKFNSTRNNDTQYDIIVIDECSTVSNEDMLSFLKKADYKILVLVGDVHQIESILFGNWFSIARSFISSNSVFELNKPYRSTNKRLLDLWGKVRNIEDDILEHITRNDYSVKLDESIFEQHEDDEIILCLNYDGLYGINNINSFLQGANPNESVEWGILPYKVDDPILFNESDRFHPVLYNNLKGQIKRINLKEGAIQFDVEVYKVINGLEAEGYDFELLASESADTSILRFTVSKHGSTDDEDEDPLSVVPFQVAYAVSIHKAQGLEYSSVKVVITDEIEEMITHNIFYTAITRAKDKLRIYWTPETEKKVLERMEKRFNGRDVSLLREKYEL